MMTFETIAKELRKCFPEVGLSFGYIGNIGYGQNAYADLDWNFFTTTWNTGSRTANCHSFHVGNTTRKKSIEQDRDALETIKRDVINWLQHKVAKDVCKPCDCPDCCPPSPRLW